MIMKIAVLFDYIHGKAGGEKLMLYIAKCFKADIYTGYIEYDKTYPEFKNMNVTDLGASKIPYLKQEDCVRKFRNLDLSDYDAAICVGFYCQYVARNKSTKVIWDPYGVSPMFYKRADYPKRNITSNPLLRIGEWFWGKKYEFYDQVTANQYIDKVVLYSEFSRKAFREHYNMDAALIPPPVRLSDWRNNESSGFYLTVSRLEPGKRVDLTINAFKTMPNEHLIIIGTGSLEKHYKEITKDNKNIQFVKNLSEKELAGFYANCTAFIGTAFYDDWSMPLVEAMASGKPCIGVNQGAYPEIITGNTGILVNDTPDDIKAAVKKLDCLTASGMSDDCKRNAKQYSLPVFNKKWRRTVKEVIR